MPSRHLQHQIADAVVSSNLRHLEASEFCCEILKVLNLRPIGYEDEYNINIIWSDIVVV